ncbi:hypothetical protein SISSUDRAFT_1042605 [Sistotremastrum suecicum HHB10207 ss-3]|uniref:Uncharacterized protein n=1 Tax=Sistotremastrum suecicum HHB10207 ss-3 TaxID=1314776 RepID=A0A166GCW4_9AGAM|nr:hypothetical protein SISSUDRAFT_1042605 [Sistotremastrum suecicum HHB10207 ss-3]
MFYKVQKQNCTFTSEINRNSAISTTVNRLDIIFVHPRGHHVVASHTFQSHVIVVIIFQAFAA